MGKVLIIKGADFSEVSVGKSYASEIEELIAEAINQENINILINQEGTLDLDGQEISLTGYYRSTYIPINELKDIVFYGDNYALLGCVYDSNKQFISAITGIVNAKLACVYFNNIISNVSGAAYVRLTVLNNVGILLNSLINDNSAYINAMTAKLASLGLGDITSLAKPKTMINSSRTYAYSNNQKSTLLLPLSALTGRTITNNGIYSDSIRPFSLYKENMQAIDYSNSITPNVPISVVVNDLLSTYSNAVYISMCVDVRATNPTIVVA